jgi:hypothetical protein
MSKGSIYLCGRMTGIPYFNFPEFFKSEEFLQKEGWEVFSPAREDIKRYGDFWKQCLNGTHEEAELACWPNKAPTYRDCMRIDLNYILNTAEAIALMPGWEFGKGTIIEKLLADVLGLRIIYL